MDRRCLLISGAAGLIGSMARPVHASTGPLPEKIDAAAGRLLAAAGACPGIAVAVYTREGVHARAYGLADIETGETASADTAFYIASTTKALTGLSMAAMHARGALDLDMTLAACAPDADFAEAVRPDEVTLRNLLNHTHGIANRPMVHRLAFTGDHDPRTLWRLLGVSTVNTDAPLGRFRYANVGYNIATVLTDRRTGVAWQDLLQQNIFQPAGMTHSSARMSTATNWSLARPHRLGPDGLAQAVYLNKTDGTMHSAGGVIMSANDAARWMELMVEGGRIGGRQIVPAEAVAATRAPLASTGTDTAYGLGWHIAPHQDETAYYHTGDFPGWAAMIAYLPKRGVGVAVFSNGDSLGGRANDALINYVFDVTGGVPEAESNLDAALQGLRARRQELMTRAEADRTERAARPWTLTRPQAAYAGRYSDPDWGDIHITWNGEALGLSYGVMHAEAEPLGQPDGFSVELLPGSEAAIRFGGDGLTPDSLEYSGQKFSRV